MAIYGDVVCTRTWVWQKLGPTNISGSCVMMRQERGFVESRGTGSDAFFVMRALPAESHSGSRRLGE